MKGPNLIQYILMNLVCRFPIDYLNMFYLSIFQSLHACVLMPVLFWQLTLMQLLKCVFLLNCLVHFITLKTPLLSFNRYNATPSNYISMIVTDFGMVNFLPVEIEYMNCNLFLRGFWSKKETEVLYSKENIHLEVCQVKKILL